MDSDITPLSPSIKGNVEESSLSEDALTSLLTKPIKFSNVLSTPPGKENFGLNTPPGKENFGLRKGVLNLSIHSPNSPVEKRVKPFGEAFKRPQCLENRTPVQSKRVKSFGDLIESAYVKDENSTDGKQCNHQSSSSSKAFLRSQSESAVSVISALDRIGSDPDLIGDCSKHYILPLVENGKHSDLREIKGETMVALLEGRYDDQVNTFEVIDCRYPYEYTGGHIRGAINLFTQKQVFDRFLSEKRPKALHSVSEERNILIFHCEFSSQRAPYLCRFLRDADRNCNMESFPSLYFPEMYILHGGYKSFFEEFHSYCDPQVYVPMDSPEHHEEFKMYKNRSKNELVSKPGGKGSKPSSFKKLRI